ncbi:hypothetical protein QLL95_gp0975 [Cotonvirus japonicus]|uniref:Minor capsid protein P8 central region domain-containing protein n=1 Tax=Cotonvirus japonicus TaxID=2811091 RepID=A0ABM7NSK3_9VIRU|nr:hypothetical protein QLL95_gp0975 [Cotonvirus japonicus]BCS83148.1 hypothetical protein [Cotonvirus japonicus]
MSLPKGAIKKNTLSTHDMMKTPFMMFQAHHDDYAKMSQQTVNYIPQESILSKLFFHPKNIDLIQKQIIMNVYRETDEKYLIERQDEKDLLVVMKSIFIQKAKHLPTNIKDQIKELDYLVVDEVTPGIISEITAHVNYIDKIFGEFNVLDRPINVSNAGNKTLPSVTSRFSQ